MKSKAGRDVAERFLFHGTKAEYVDAICRENIDWRLCGENGTNFGRGEFMINIQHGLLESMQNSNIK